MKILFLILLISPFFVEAKSFFIYKNDKASPVIVKEYKKLNLTETCFKADPPTCDALKATVSKVLVSKNNSPVLAHPASKFCEDHGGVSRILQTKEGAQYDYCMFKDGSMIDSWDLYNHFFPQKK